ncbi:response regulator [Magnetococcus sp. PR-3]|uniref:response regulator n=1 Tax=Magnetococcus sp. PR-3 TaxID=3120355 RepID=UPI002FCE19F9
MNDVLPIILAVDDTPDNIDVLAGILKPAHKVKVALNGEKALKIAAKAPHPDLILLDVMMPGMDGYEVCEQLKAHPETASIPVIFITGNTAQEEIDKGMALGAMGYLSKPIDPDALLAQVKKALQG